jgi:hypothetical protein
MYFSLYTPPSPQFGLKSGYSQHVGLSQLGNMISVCTALLLFLPMSPILGVTEGAGGGIAGIGVGGSRGSGGGG